MIPEHIKGKSAEQIIDEMTLRFISGTHNYGEDYVKYLEGLLLLAVKDALCNCDGMQGTYVNYVESVEGKTIVFLNTVLPKE